MKHHKHVHIDAVMSQAKGAWGLNVKCIRVYYVCVRECVRVFTCSGWTVGS